MFILPLQEIYVFILNKHKARENTITLIAKLYRYFLIFFKFQQVFQLRTNIYSFTTKPKITSYATGLVCFESYYISLFL